MSIYNANHKCGKNTRAYCVYTVYDNKTDFPVIIDGDARACAYAMGMKLNSFYCAIKRAENKTIKRWTIERHYLDGKPNYMNN